MWTWKLNMHDNIMKLQWSCRSFTKPQHPQHPLAYSMWRHLAWCWCCVHKPIVLDRVNGHEWISHLQLHPVNTFCIRLEKWIVGDFFTSCCSCHLLLLNKLPENLCLKKWPLRTASAVDSWLLLKCSCRHCSSKLALNSSSANSRIAIWIWGSVHE